MVPVGHSNVSILRNQESIEFNECFSSICLINANTILTGGLNKLFIIDRANLETTATLCHPYGNFNCQLKVCGRFLLGLTKGVGDFNYESKCFERFLKTKYFVSSMERLRKDDFIIGQNLGCV